MLTNLGSDFTLRTGDGPTDPKVPTMTVDEFASTPLEELERNIEENNWKFCMSADPVLLQKETQEPSDIIKAKSVHRGKARKAHRAANLVCGFDVPRAALRAAEQDKVDKTDRYRLEKIALMKQQSALKGDSVAINEIADVTKVRSIPIMELKTFNEKYMNYHALCHRHPHAWEECSIQQLTCVEDLLKHAVCYVDLSIFGSNHQRSAKLMRVAGKVVGSDGTLQNQEFKGPSDYFLFR